MNGLATVVRVVGSAYRRPGARMLLRADRPPVGLVSGGCLEEDVRQVALEVIRDRTPRQLRYKTGADDETVWVMSGWREAHGMAIRYPGARGDLTGAQNACNRLIDIVTHKSLAARSRSK